MAYSRFEDGDILINSEKVSTPIWSNNSDTLLGSALIANNTGSYSSDFYIDVVDISSEDIKTEVQFSISYADKLGSGSEAYNTDLASYSPSRTIYGQCRSLVLGDEESTFSFTDGVESENFWAIFVDRARFKESLRTGSLSVVIGASGSSSEPIIIKDESALNSVTETRYKDSGRVYYLYGAPAEQDTTGKWIKSETGEWTKGYGFFLPDIGALLLDCKKLYKAVGKEENDIRYSSTGSATSVSPYQNSETLLKAIKSFSLKAEETVTSNYVWVRVKNSEFNYSMNPSFITSTGELRQNIMINSPETYITTVGLYNDNADCLAVAKLSRPLSKSFSKEALIRIKLDY